MKRRSLAFASLFLASLATPAVAQTGTSASVTGVSNGQAVSDSVAVGASGSATVGIKRIEISINGSTVRYETFGGLRTNASISYNWDTTRTVTGGRNGSYTVTARVLNNNGNTATRSVTVNVNNGTSTPSGVSASNGGGTVTISWNANPEPDITSYVVERSSAGGWDHVASTGSTSLTDTPGPGDHSYRVIAVRASPVSSGNASAPSAGASVHVPAASSGGSGAGSGSGSGSGDAGSGKGSKGGGSGIPGYRGGKGGKSGSKAAGKTGSGYGGIGFAGGRALGSIRLPGRLSLPGRAGAARAEIAGLPSEDGWGTFEETLPYNIPDDATFTEQIGNGVKRIAALSPWRVVPPDGLRWIAAGLWLLVTAALLSFLERQLANREATGGSNEEASLEEATTPLTYVLRPARDPRVRVPSIVTLIDVVGLNVAAATPLDSVARNLEVPAPLDLVAPNVVTNGEIDIVVGNLAWETLVDVVAANMVVPAPQPKVDAIPHQKPARREARPSGRKTARRKASSTIKRPTAKPRRAAKRTPKSHGATRKAAAKSKIRRSVRTRTVKQTARKRTAQQRAISTRDGRAATRAVARQKPHRSAKTTTARKTSGGPKAKKTPASKRANNLRLVKNDVA